MENMHLSLSQIYIYIYIYIKFTGNFKINIIIPFFLSKYENFDNYDGYYWVFIYYCVCK